MWCLRPACPALSGPRPSRSSSWPVINIQCEVRGMPLAVLVAGELVSGRRLQPPAPSVALNPIRTRWMEHLERRPPCLRITPFRTSCGRPDPAAGVVCGTMTRCVRHCRRYDHYRGTVGDTSSSYEEICVYGLQYRHKPNLCGEWRHRHNDASCGRISTPHAQSVWSVWRGQQPATVLRSVVHHADSLIRQQVRPAGP